MENFGQRLRRIRGERPQIEVAAEMGLPQTTLSTLENQKSVPRGEVVRKLAEYYKVPIEYFYEEQQRTPLTRSEAASAWLRSLPQLQGKKDSLATQSEYPVDAKTRKKIAEALRQRHEESSDK